MNSRLTWAAICAAVFVVVQLGTCAINSWPLPKRIHWEDIPAETGPYKPPKRTENQEALEREHKRMYAALKFEREPRKEL